MLDSYVYDYDEVRIRIDKEYLLNSATNILGHEVVNEDEMMRYFAAQVDSMPDDNLFNRFIDSVLNQAVEQGEEWIKIYD